MYEMSRRRTALLATIASIVMFAACGDDPPDAATASAPGSAAPSVTTTPVETVVQAPSSTVATPEGSTPVSGDIDPGLKPFIDIAVADLAQRLSVAPTDVAVTSATLVEWPDGSMGCPQPGQVYTQVITDGSLIVLVANGRSYQYHAGGSVKPFLCEQPAKSPPTTG